MRTETLPAAGTAGFAAVVAGAWAAGAAGTVVWAGFDASVGLAAAGAGGGEPPHAARITEPPAAVRVPRNIRREIMLRAIAAIPSAPLPYLDRATCPLDVAGARPRCQTKIGRHTSTRPS